MRNCVKAGLAAGCILWAGAAAAQGFDRPIQLADRGPIFYSAPASGGHVTDVRNAAVFRQAIALNLTDATVEQALDSIQAAGHVEIDYLRDRLPNGQPVTLQAS